MTYTSPTKGTKGYGGSYGSPASGSVYGSAAMPQRSPSFKEKKRFHLEELTAATA
jgi:hypothetical protein